jgi:hypothetical protein
MVTKLLRKAVPTPLHPPVRRAVLLLIPPLRRRLTRTWRSRSRLKGLLRRQLKRTWRRCKRLERSLLIEKNPHRQYVFRRAMRRFSALPQDAAIPRTVLSDLIYGWGYKGSVKHEYASAFLRYARTADGPILECGSGLSTILLGLTAERTGNKVWSLEDKSFWAEKVRSTLQRYDIKSVELCKTNLRDYGPYWWYDPPKVKMPKNFSLVVCDGPPASTPGGRYGMLPIMKPHLKPGCIVLLDDARRVEERKILATWAQESGTSYRIEGVAKPFGIVWVVGKGGFDPLLRTDQS